MARLPRIIIPNQPVHIMPRGNNRQDIFETEEDMVRITEDIAYALSKADCYLHHGSFEAFYKVRRTIPLGLAFC